MVLNSSLHAANDNNKNLSKISEQELLFSNTIRESLTSLNNRLEKRNLDNYVRELVKKDTFSGLEAGIKSSDNSVKLNDNSHLANNLNKERIQIKFLSLLSQEVKPEIYTTWFKPIHIEEISYNEDLFTVTTCFPNSFSVDHIKSKYFYMLESSLEKAISREMHATEETATGAVFNCKINLVFKVVERKNTHKTSVKVVKAPRKHRKTISSNDNLNSKYLFSNFVIGKCNQLAHAVGTQVSKNIGEVYNPLFIYGGVGLGKTHLVNAIGNQCKLNNQKVLLVSSEDFVNQLITSIRNNSTQNFKKKFRSLDLLIIDDIQFLAGKERTQEEFFHTFNELFQRGKQIVITSDKLPQQLTGLEERLRTRFASGISVDMSKPEYETRVAILRKKADQLNINIADDVINYIAENICSNVRELEGALNRVSALGNTFHSGVDLSIAKDVVESFNPRVCTVEITPVNIQEAVARHFSIGVSDILGKRRTKAIAKARHISMYLCRQLTGCSYPELGVLFGGRDHATVIHACKSVETKMKENKSLKLEIEALKNVIC